MLFELPSEVYAHICEQWIEADELCRLDSAICNVVLRSRFLLTLELLRQPFHGILDTNRTHITQRYYDWLIKRKLYVRHLAVPADAQRSLYARLLSIAGENVSHLLFDGSIDRYSYAVEDMRIQLLGRCSTLQSLVFEKGYEVSLPLLQQLQISGTALQHLEIQNLKVAKTSEAVECITQWCRQLEHLALHFHVTLNDLQKIAMQCFTLKTLRVVVDDNMSQFCSQDQRGVAVNHLQIIGQALRQLTSLDLSNSTAIEEYGLRALLPQLMSLRVLKLSNCRTIGNECMQVIAENLPHLLHLDCSFCNSVTEKGLLKLAQNLRILEVLNVEQCAGLSDEVLQAATIHLQHIICINISNCIGTSDATIQNIARHCSSLEELKFSNSCNDQYVHSCLSDAALHSLASYSNNLRSLSIHNCRGITDAGVISVASVGMLTRISLMKCENIGDEAILALADHCPQLRSLDVSGCFLISDVAIKVLMTRCSKLEELAVSHCLLLTDVAMIALVRGLRYLKSLAVGSCAQLTDEMLKTVADHCKQLHSLDISRCHQITAAAVDSLITSCHKLRKLKLSRSIAQGSLEKYPVAISIDYLS